MNALRNSKGTILVITLATLTLASIFIVTSFRYTDLGRALVTNYKFKRSFNLGATKIRNLINNRAALYDSLADPINPELRACLIDDSAFDGDLTPDCVAETFFPVTVSILPPGEPRQIISGRDDDSAARYSWTGELCSLPTSNCGSQTFRVVTAFKAICEGGAPSCRLAQRIMYRINITPYDGSGVAPLEVFRTLPLKTNDKWAALVRPGKPEPPPPDPHLPPPTGGGDDDEDEDNKDHTVDETVTPEPRPVNPPSCPWGQASRNGRCFWFAL